MASAADQSWQTDYHGLYERLPWLVQHSGLLWTDHICDSPKIKKKIFQLHYGNSASKCVSVQWQTELPSVCMQSNNVAVRLYNGMEVMFLMTVLYSTIKTAIKTVAMFCNTLHKGTILHCSPYFQDDFLIFLVNGLQGQRKWTANSITSTCTIFSEVDDFSL